MRRHRLQHWSGKKEGKTQLTVAASIELEPTLINLKLVRLNTSTVIFKIVPVVSTKDGLYGDVGIEYDTFAGLECLDPTRLARVLIRNERSHVAFNAASPERID